MAPIGIGMPQPLDTPSPLSPSGVDSQSSSASGSEATTYMSSGSKDIPHAIKLMAVSMDPSLTRHDLDYLMHVIEANGLMASFGSAEFQQGLKQAVLSVSGSVGRVLSARGLR